MARYRVRTDQAVSSPGSFVVDADHFSVGNHSTVFWSDEREEEEILRVFNARVVSIALESSETWILEAKWDGPSQIGPFPSKDVALAYGAQYISDGNYGAVRINKPVRST